MQSLILANIKNKRTLHNILDWGKKNPFQMFFPKNIKTLNYILKNIKYDKIITTDKMISEELNKRDIEHENW